MQLRLIFRCDQADVAVFAPDTELSPSLSLPLTSDGLEWGQAVYFYGAPGGSRPPRSPRPVITTASVAAITKGVAGESPFLLEGHAKPGSSGAPVLWRDSRTGGLGICGLLVSARPAPLGPATGELGRAVMPVRDPGIIKCVNIAQVVVAIEGNPDGLPLAAPEP